MATVQLFRSEPVFQSYGSAAWNVVLGDRDNFWGFSARPYQARDTVVLEEVSSNSDNNLNQSTDVVVTLLNNEGPAGGGGLIRITTIRVSG